MVLGDLERLEDALLDGDRGDDDDELGEPVALVEAEDGAEVDVGLARARLHLDGEVARGERRRRAEAVADLDAAEVGEQLVVQEREAVAVAEAVLGVAEGELAALGWASRR